MHNRHRGKRRLLVSGRQPAGHRPKHRPSQPVREAGRGHLALRRAPDRKLSKDAVPTTPSVVSLGLALLLGSAARKLRPVSTQVVLQCAVIQEFIFYFLCLPNFSSVLQSQVLGQKEMSQSLWRVFSFHTGQRLPRARDPSHTLQGVLLVFSSAESSQVMLPADHT